MNTRKITLKTMESHIIIGDTTPLAGKHLIYEASAKGVSCIDTAKNTKVLHKKLKELSGVALVCSKFTVEHVSSIHDIEDNYIQLTLHNSEVII